MAGSSKLISNISIIQKAKNAVLDWLESVWNTIKDTFKRSLIVAVTEELIDFLSTIVRVLTKQAEGGYTLLEDGHGYDYEPDSRYSPDIIDDLFEESRSSSIYNGGDSALTSIELEAEERATAMVAAKAALKELGVLGMSIIFGILATWVVKKLLRKAWGNPPPYARIEGAWLEPKDFEIAEFIVIDRLIIIAESAMVPVLSPALAVLATNPLLAASTGTLTLAFNAFLSSFSVALISYGPRINNTLAWLFYINFQKGAIGNWDPMRDSNWSGTMLIPGFETWDDNEFQDTVHRALVQYGQNLEDAARMETYKEYLNDLQLRPKIHGYYGFFDPKPQWAPSKNPPKAKTYQTDNSYQYLLNSNPYG